MSIELIPAKPEHADAIARIAFAAFQGISQRHGFQSEIFSPEMAQAMAGGFLHRPDVDGVVAIDRGEVVGMNFVQLSDAVAGVGPICVDPARQCGGIGRLLMQYIIDHTRQRHGPMIRLLQESFNMASLSLYASLAFVVREPIALMSVPLLSEADPSIRPLTAGDVDAADALCRATQRVSRRNELLGMIANGPSMGVVPHGRFTGGELTAFVVPGFFGFAAARNPDDLLQTARAAVATLPPPLQLILIPVRNGPLFARALAEGFRSVKVFQLMAMGPYEEPVGDWSPSIAY